MRLTLLCTLSICAAAQSSEVKELRFKFYPEGRVRPGESVEVQVQVWGDSIAKSGERTSGRLREAAKITVRDAKGSMSKPFRHQGSDNEGFVSNGDNRLVGLLTGALGQVAVKDAAIYTAPDLPGKYEVEATAKGVTARAEIEVTSDASSTRPVEKHSFNREPDTNRYRPLAEYWAPFLAQETWWQPKSDIPTRFDFDGDWNGGNNWDNMEGGTSQAYVHYAGVETPTHWFLHYNIFHPRDYSDNCIAGTCHENDNEGIILTIRKDGSPNGKLEAMQTLAHNNVYSYAADQRLKKGAHDIDGRVDFWQEHHPMVFIEAGGHGVLGATSRQSTFDAVKNAFKEGTGMTFVYKGAAERARNAEDREVGYDLIPIETAWWARVNSNDKTYDAVYTYQPFGNRPGAGRKYPGSFFGREKGDNKAKPFWGWHDERTRKGKVLNTGLWALDPAYSVSRNLIFPADLPVDLNYTYNPYLGIDGAAAPVQPPPAETARTRENLIVAGGEGNCELEVGIDGTVTISLQNSAAEYEVGSGQPANQTKLACTGPWPASGPKEFSMNKSRGRGAAKLVEQPSPSNGFKARVQVEDPARGADRYVLQFRWKF